MLKNVSLLFVLLIVISMGAFFIAKRHCLFSGFNPEILLNKYAENEIAHFSYFAFQEGKLRKWEGDIRLKIEEKTSIDEDVLNSIYFCVQQINSMVDLISVVEVEQNYNVSIALVDTLIPGYDGFTYKYYDEDYIEKPEIISGEIVIVLKGNKLPLINSTIHHEFTHLLGFNHNQDLYRDSEWTYKSLFNQSTTTYVRSE